MLNFERPDISNFWFHLGLQTNYTSFKIRHSVFLVRYSALPTKNINFPAVNSAAPASLTGFELPSRLPFSKAGSFLLIPLPH